MRLRLGKAIPRPLLVQSIAVVAVFGNMSELDSEMSALLDERALSKLKWRCRRGLLENDLLIEKFFQRFEATLTVSQAKGMNDLMDLSDNDLLDLLLKRKNSSELSDLNACAKASSPEALETLTMLRPAAAPNSPSRLI